MPRRVRPRRPQMRVTDDDRVEEHRRWCVDRLGLEELAHAHDADGQRRDRAAEVVGTVAEVGAEGDDYGVGHVVSS
jgi:hypothetical protein